MSLYKIKTNTSNTTTAPDVVNKQEDVAIAQYYTANSNRVVIGQYCFDFGRILLIMLIMQLVTMLGVILKK